jgi:predicted MFS family arabinose efflux permease
MRSYRDLFGVPEFRPMFVALSIAFAAVTLQGLALATLVFDRTASPFLSAIALFGGSFGHVLGATLLLSAADRIPPRLALTALPAAFGVAALVVGLPDMPIAAILAVVLALGLLDSLGAGVRWGLLIEILPVDGYVLGRSVMQMTVGAMQILAAATGAIALQLVSPATLLVTSASLFAASAVLVQFGLRERPPRGSGRVSPRETMRVNRLLWLIPGVPTVYLALWVPNGLVVGAEALFVPYATTSAGALFVAGAAGMLAGDALMGRWAPVHWRRRLITPMYLVLAVPYLIFVFQPDIPAAVVLVAVASAGFSAGLLLQEQLIALTPGEIRGQVLGLHSSGMLIFQGVGAVVAGTIAELVQEGHAMAIMAAISVAVTIALTPGLRRNNQCAAARGNSR